MVLTNQCRLTRRYPMIKQMIKKESIPEIDYLYLDMNGIIYRCVRVRFIIFRTIQSSSKHSSCLNNSNKYGYRSLTILTHLSIWSNQLKWLCWRLMVSLPGARWTTKEQEDSAVLRNTKISLASSMATRTLLIVKKTSKIIQFPQERVSWLNLMKCFIFSYRKKLICVLLCCVSELASVIMYCIHFWLDLT